MAASMKTPVLATVAITVAGGAGFDQTGWPTSSTRRARSVSPTMRARRPAEVLVAAPAPRVDKLALRHDATTYLLESKDAESNALLGEPQCRSATEAELSDTVARVVAAGSTLHPMVLQLGANLAADLAVQNAMNKQLENLLPGFSAAIKDQPTDCINNDGDDGDDNESGDDDVSSTHGNMHRSIDSSVSSTSSSWAHVSREHEHEHEHDQDHEPPFAAATLDVVTTPKSSSVNVKQTADELGGVPEVTRLVPRSQPSTPRASDPSQLSFEASAPSPVASSVIGHSAVMISESKAHLFRSSSFLVSPTSVAPSPSSAPFSDAVVVESLPCSVATSALGEMPSSFALPSPSAFSLLSASSSMSSLSSFASSVSSSAAMGRGAGSRVQIGGSARVASPVGRRSALQRSGVRQARAAAPAASARPLSGLAKIVTFFKLMFNAPRVTKKKVAKERKLSASAGEPAMRQRPARQPRGAASAVVQRVAPVVAPAIVASSATSLADSNHRPAVVDVKPVVIVSASTEPVVVPTVAPPAPVPAQTSQGAAPAEKKKKRTKAEHPAMAAALGVAMLLFTLTLLHRRHPSAARRLLAVVTESVPSMSGPYYSAPPRSRSLPAPTTTPAPLASFRTRTARATAPAAGPAPVSGQ